MPGSAPASAETAEIAELLQAVSHRIRRDARHELAPADITWAQLRTLRTLVRCGDGSRMSELADALHVARRSATSLVDELESRGLVERRSDPTDRRSVRVGITAAGRRLLSELGRRRHEAAERILGVLSRAELRTMRDLLARLTE